MEMIMKILQNKSDVNVADNEYYEEVLQASLIHH